MHANSLKSRLLCLAGGAALTVAALVGAQSSAEAKSSLSLGMVLEPPHLDATAGAAAAIDEVVYQNIFQGLTRIGADGSVLPSLAKSWDVSDDGLTYRFHLNTGVVFHDGTPFSAQDVKFSFDRARSEDSVNAQKPLFSAIEEVVVVDPDTVDIKLNTPSGNLTYNLAWGDAIIVSAKSVDTNKTHPVGTGPFKFDRWMKGQEIRVSRFDKYWGDQPKLEQASFRIISDPNAAFAAMISGDLDAFPLFPTPETIVQFQADPRFEVAIGTTEGETILAMNNARGPLKNKLVRQAISHAIDKQALIDGAMFGFGTPIGTHFAPHHPAYTDLTGLYPYDLAKAKELLTEAGYPDGFSATLKLPPPTYARRGGELIASDLKKIGIDLKIIPVEWAQWLSEVYKETNYDFTIVSHVEPMDIGIYGRENYYFNYHSEAFTKLIEQLNVTADDAQRNELLVQAQKLITDDAVNVYLFQLAKSGVWNANVKGLWINAPMPSNDLSQVYWANE
ncbi:Periplasmic dipeptide transport protein precursor [Pseudovibrio axinellae]|uniref:Periplasmic dipeptide transport protein n=1 Tax=Pseudovibrio axinellae TaxID=989403 RepID=A0A161XGR3_9HYPH|nr:ABC transporter substrate-binding protein [Pseudovibrio axinellae]KZL21038.1 Periplasmic dipeptide transport protein precursor [Pseudovibrio axinellae]SEP77966.1 peptide/nickel transport system substrate-binding protein [Pseudovibrio axinellae]